MGLCHGESTDADGHLPHEGRERRSIHKEIGRAVLPSVNRVARLGNWRSYLRHGIAGLLATVGWARVASGADEPVILSWSAPADADCPDGAYALREIRRHLGPARNERKPIRANVVIRAVRAGYYQMVLKTQQGDAEGERILHDASCGAVADAAIVVLAWMIDPTAMAERSRETTPPPAPAVVAEPVQPSPTPPLPRRALAFVAGVGPSGDIGTLPSPAMGAEGRVAISVRPLGVGVYGAYWPSQTATGATLPDGRSTGGTFTLWALGLQACFELPFSPHPDAASVSLCGGPELDVMKGRGFGVNNPGEGSESWAAATAALRANVPLGGPWRLALAIAGVLPARRERFALQGVGEVHQPAAAAGRAALDVEFAF
jgi:hypothetical protein